MTEPTKNCTTVELRHYFDKQQSAQDRCFDAELRIRDKQIEAAKEAVGVALTATEKKASQTLAVINTIIALLAAAIAVAALWKK